MNVPPDVYVCARAAEPDERPSPSVTDVTVDSPRLKVTFSIVPSVSEAVAVKLTVRGAAPVVTSALSPTQVGATFAAVVGVSVAVGLAVGSGVRLGDGDGDSLGVGSPSTMAMIAGVLPEGIRTSSLA